jgi:hypothetical protein
VTTRRLLPSALPSKRARANVPAGSMWRILHERNDLVDAINEILRVDKAQYQLTRVVTREEPTTGRFGQEQRFTLWPGHESSARKTK